MIDNTVDIIDSRDVIQRIQELKDEWSEATEEVSPDWYVLSEDDWAVGLGWDGAREIVALLELAEEGQELADWEYGETLVRDSYFTEYAEQLAEDIGAIDLSASLNWPLQYIDWERAAEALQMDYVQITFDGVTYWARA